MLDTKLLYVDDERGNLSNFKLTFGDDYEILTAMSGEEGLEIFQSLADIAIVVADQRMPGMSGVECLEKIYRHNPDTIRMVLTAYLDTDNIVQAINRGHVYQYFFKPWREEELRIALNLAREKYHLGRENSRLATELNARNNELLQANELLTADVKRRRQAEAQIRELTQELFAAQENERKRIAFDLHDNVAQDLFTLKIGCETLFDDMSKVPRRVQKKLDKISEILTSSVKTVRDMSYDLRPFNLDKLGLLSAVMQYSEEFALKNNLQLDFDSAGMDGMRLEQGIEISIYRLLQEALSNVRKHARATTLVVKLVASFPNVILRVEDDGQGFDLEKRQAETVQEKRMGLRSMEERVGHMRGKLQIRSRLGQGTKIFIEIPVSAP